jgi:branched-chain amino acid transport system substrate-binding protein
MPAALAQGKDIKIAHIYSKTGPLEAYGKQTQTGLMMGLSYATGGTMEVAGRKIVVIEKDDQGKPDLGQEPVGCSLRRRQGGLGCGSDRFACGAGHAAGGRGVQKDFVGRACRGRLDHGRQVEQIHFPHGRNSSQDAIANAVAVDKDGVSIVTMAQDSAFGRDGVKAFKDSVKKAKLVHEEYLPPATTDFTAGAQRMIDKLKGLPGRKIIFIIWAGGNPFKIADMDLKRHGIEIATGGNILPAMVAYKQFPGMEGAAYYYFGMPKNPVNDAMVASHYQQFKSPPDFFTAGGFSAAMALVTALKKDQWRHQHQQAHQHHGRHEL